MSTCTALVTGASSGIGAAFARRLAIRGHHLILVARDEKALRDYAGELTAAHQVRVEVLAADLRDDSQLAKVEMRLRQRENPVELLVNNAAFGTTGPFDRSSSDEQVGQVQVNVLAPLRLTHAALQEMRARGRGGIVNVSSIAGFGPAPGLATYGATKSFVTNLTESLFHELRGSGVVVTCVCPGYTRTAFHARAGISTTSVPSSAWLLPDEVAVAALAAHENGEFLVVPGTLNSVTVRASRLGARGAGGVARRVGRLASALRRSET